jgi:hypothetical protein
MQATRNDPLIRFATLSSLVAHVGNPGQTLYGAANAALETLTHPTAPTVHVAFTAWAERGMAFRTGTLPALRSRGLHPLTDAEGAALFLAALGATDTVLATADAPAEAAAPPWPLGDAAARGHHVDLDPASPELADHALGGRAIVPAALWLAAMRALLDGEGVTDFRVHVPVFVDRKRTDVLVLLDRDRLSIEASGTLVASATRSADPPRADDAPPIGLASPPPYAEGTLFHGPAWQTLAAVSPDGTTATLRPTSLDPLATALDGVHQLAALWGRRVADRAFLPVSAAAWRWHAWGDAVPAAVRLRPRLESDAVVCDAVVWDASGAVFAEADGVRLAAASAARAAL